MYTPEEASKLWCPFIRLIPQIVTPEGKVPGPTGNAFTQEDGYVARPGCIHVGCMMWRWSYTTFNSDGEPNTGFCGLAPRTAGAGGPAR